MCVGYHNIYVFKRNDTNDSKERKQLRDNKNDNKLFEKELIRELFLHQKVQ